MTTGRGSEPVAQCSDAVDSSMTSAFALSSSTVARRTVHTLIGSYVALRTSTRPPDQRPMPSVPGPCRWWSSRGTDPSGTGALAVAMCARSVPEGSGGSVECDRDRLPRERQAHGLRLLRRELPPATPRVHLLAVQTGRVAVGDAGEDEAVAVRVEEGERRGLMPRQLAVGVVTDERAMGEGAVEPALDPAHPVLE